jgi:septal ring factor EnvC (AmiA/AmiB activator)
LAIVNVQVDEGNLTRLQEAAAQKASRLQGQQQQLEQLQQRLGGLQEELGQLERQLAAKKEEAKGAQAEHRKSRCGSGQLGCDYRNGSTFCWQQVLVGY